MDIILVSASPRRKEILEKAGLKFYIETVEISEIVDKNLNLEAAMSQLATDKMHAFLTSDKALKYKDFLAITADTMVVLSDRLLGKPSTKEEAFEYLRQMSGQEHLVCTAVCLYDSSTKSEVVHCEKTFIDFNLLSDEQIWSYIESDQPMDKAGAYGIQDATVKNDFVKSIRGSFYNVMGFPIEWLMQELKKRKWLDD